MKKRDLDQEHGLRQARAAAREALTDLSIVSLPIDIEAVIRSKDIDLKPLPPTHTSFSGAFVYASTATSGAINCGILYSTSVPSEGFRRFTMAHEFGHYSIAEHGMHIVGPDGWHCSAAGYASDEAIEREADAFASEFLMPEANCRQLLRHHDEGMACVIAMSQACAVSLTAAACRYADLTDGNAAVVLCSGGVVQACFRSRALQDCPWSWSLRRGGRIPLGSPTRRLWDNTDLIARGQSLDNEVRWSDWFDGAPRQGVFEETKGLGSAYGKTITVLSLAADEELESEDD